ncbi:MAG: hydrolase [Thermoleophilia bacterium]|nr:hydrolase [Thermoleophilia bacterium]GIK78014.1 MAG: hydrolase [Actinomycetes bacterium]
MSAKLDPERAALVIVDVQEGFRKAIPGFDRIAAATATLARGAEAMDLPVLVTEQYPKGLGPTAPEVAEALPAGAEPLAKTVFSAAAADGFDLGGRGQAVVCGIEAHVCVNQTVLDLLDRGIEVHVVADAVGSRSDPDRELGLAKAERSGAWLTSVEMALFELLGTAGSDRFKAVQKLVLEHAP